MLPEYRQWQCTGDVGWKLVSQVGSKDIVIIVVVVVVVVLLVCSSICSRICCRCLWSNCHASSASNFKVPAVCSAHRRRQIISTTFLQSVPGYPQSTIRIPTRRQYSLWCKSTVLATPEMCVCVTPYQYDASYDHEIFTVGSGKNSATAICKGFPEIGTGSPRLRALNERGVGKTGDFQPISCRISKTVRDRTKVVPLVTNRKSYMRFQLVPRSTTLDDLGWPLTAVPHSTALIIASFGAHHANLNGDRLTLSAANGRKDM